MGCGRWARARCRKCGGFRITDTDGEISYQLELGGIATWAPVIFSANTAHSQRGCKQDWLARCRILVFSNQHEELTIRKERLKSEL